MKKLLLASSAALMASTGISSAVSLLIDFGATTAASPYLTLSPGHATGAVSASETSWNKVSSSAAVTSLVYGDGVVTSGLTLSMGQEAAANSNVISYSTPIANVALAGTGGSAAGQQSLFGSGSIYGDNTSSTAATRDGFFGAASSAIGVRLDGLSAGTYNIYVTARNTNTNAASVPMSIYTTAGTTAGTFDFSTLTGQLQSNPGYTTAAYNGEYTTFINGANYVMSSVTLTSGQSLYLAVDGVSAADLRGFLNSIEIVAVPEPSTALLGLAGALVVLRSRRR